MSTSTYSFLDVSGFINHPVLGPYTFTGQGVGEITVSMDVDRTVHDVAADGSVMVSKVAGNPGRITINVQQTSDLYKWLIRAYNLSIIGNTSIWAGLSVLIRSVTDATSHTCTGVSFNKLPDKTYAASGGKVSFVLPAADILTIPA